MVEMDTQIVRLITTSRDKFRALVDGIDDEVMSIDSNFSVIVVNKALADVLDLHPRDVVGRPCHKVIYGFDTPCPEHGLPCPALEAERGGKVQMVFHELPDPDPNAISPRYLDVRAMPVYGGDSHTDETIIVRRDVTQQKRAEKQLQDYNVHLEAEVAKRTAELVQTNEELKTINEELMSLQRLKEDLTNMVVHDLKGPLAEIQANLAMMSASDVDEFQNEVLEAAKLGSNDLERMILNLLDVSRLEENRIVLDRKQFNISELIRETIDRMEPLARLQEIRLSAEAVPELPELYADPNLMQRVFNNLLSNALDYTPAQGSITVSVEFDDSEYKIMVEDTGRGIPSELHESIFDKFSQGETGRPKTSSGLGLTFCRLAVEAHGGKIWVESEPKIGSKFIFTLPYTELPDDDCGLLI